jgi:hypothetical protein
LVHGFGISQKLDPLILNYIRYILNIKNNVRCLERKHKSVTHKELASLGDPSLDDPVSSTSFHRVKARAIQFETSKSQIEPSAPSPLIGDGAESGAKGNTKTVISYYILDTTGKQAISNICAYCDNNFKTIKSLEFKI